MASDRGYAAWQAITCCLAAILAGLAAAPLAAAPVRHSRPALPPVLAAPPPKPALPPAQLNVALAVALSDRAGQRRAGLLCFPNGELRVRDFASSEVAFRSIIEQAVHGRKPAPSSLGADGTTLSITLKALKANLCARAWGAFGKGDRVSLTGITAATFDWTLDAPVGARSDTTVVELEIPRGEGAAPEEILRLAVSRLLDVIAGSEKPG